MNAILLHNGLIVNENESFYGSVLLKGEYIHAIFKTPVPNEILAKTDHIIELNKQLLIPGVIDDQVHFREPGLTHKADLYTESKAAVAGGTTTFMEMPNTNPHTITQKELDKKFALATQKSLANFSFYIGATNDNIDELLLTDPKEVCGIKIFMGSSTGNMLVDNPESLEQIFRKCRMLIAVHCEDENIIKTNEALFREKYGEEIPVKYHPQIRSEEACYASSSKAVQMAKKHNTRLHVLHLSTSKETELFQNNVPPKDKLITSEVCIHHLWFDENDYAKMGTKIKWNPAIKKTTDKTGLLTALLEDKIDVVATDHAPHTMEEKGNTYFNAPSGGPLVQHSLAAMLEFYHQGMITLEKIVEKMCHTPAEIFQIDRRGFIREGYYGDLVVVDLNNQWKVDINNILYKCQWSPFENQTFNSKIIHTFINGNHVYNNGLFNETKKGKRITFIR